MDLIDTEFQGLYIINNDHHPDNRGSFTKIFHKEHLRNIGHVTKEIYFNRSYKNTLRGLHYQTGKNAQSKLISCLQGAFLDIALDIRENSKTYGIAFTYEMSSNLQQSIYIPTGFAHATLAREDDTIVLCNASEMYDPDAEKGFHWTSIPHLIEMQVNFLTSEKDINLPIFNTK